MKSTRMMRKHLSADSLVALLRNRFEKLTDPRSGEPSISVADALMSAFAMFFLKDPLPAEEIRPAFGDVFRALQRGKVLESYCYLDEGYLLALDGTGYFSSDKVHCPN